MVLQVVVLDWLCLGRPAACPGDLWPWQPLSKRQWNRVKLLEDLSKDGNSLFEVNAELMARAAVKTEAASDQIEALLSTIQEGAVPCDGVTSSAFRSQRKNEDEEWSGLAGLYVVFEGSLCGDPFVAAKPIQADRIQFVGSLQFDPMPFFDEATAKAYSKPLDCVRAEPGMCPPKVSDS